jgi:hypothetical protein
MKTVSRMMFALSLLATVNPLWAADDSPSGFYALESLASVPRDGKQLKPLSDVQLAKEDFNYIDLVHLAESTQFDTKF